MSELWSKAFGTLRWLRRDGELVLQELWVEAFSDKQEWRDVPIVELPPNQRAPAKGVHYAQAGSVKAAGHGPGGG